MEEFRQKLIETQNQVNSFRNTLESLDGLTVHTYHYHHEITVHEEKGGGGGGRGAATATEAEAEWWETEYGMAPPPTGGNWLEQYPEYAEYYAQRGAWFTREGLYYLHRGEMVLPRRVAEWFRRGGLAPRNIVVNVNIHASASSPQDWDEVARIISRKIVSNLRVMA